MDEYEPALITIVALILIALFIWIKPLFKVPKGKITKKWDEQRQRVLENDKERVTEKEIQALIVELKLPQVVLNLFDDNYKDEVLQRHFLDYTPPDAILSLTKKEQDNYLIDRYKPVLAYGHATIFAYDTVSKGFMTYDIELSPKEGDLKCLTWDGLFVSEILRWWEYELTNEDIMHIGTLFGLRHTKEILASIVSTTNDRGFPTFEASEKWENDMIGKINARIEII